MRMVKKSHPEGSRLPQVALVHLILIGAVPLDEGQNGGVIGGFVEVLSIASLGHVEECSRVGNEDVLLFDEFLHQQPLHCLAHSFQAKRGLGVCFSAEYTFEGSTCHQLRLKQNFCVPRPCDHSDIVHGRVKWSDRDPMIGEIVRPSPDDR